MGASLSSHRAENVRNRSNWLLLGEYTSHSIKTLDECAAIFLGDDPGSDEESVTISRNSRLARVGSSVASPGFSSLSSPTRSSQYPRFLTFDEFEEVFGMLVADANPHFDVFFTSGSASLSSRGEVVCAHLVFCCLALLAHADLHSKVQFLLRLYAVDAHGQLPTERKRLLLDDFLAALSLVLSLSEPIQHETTSYLEKTLFSSDDKSGTTNREFYAFCFTTARVSGYLHDIQSAIQELTKLLEKHNSHRHQQHHWTHGDTSSATSGAGNSRLKLLNRGATMLQLTSESLFWSLRARDLPWFWRQEHVKLHEETTVSEALQAMKALSHASSLLVIGATNVDYLGCLVIEDFSNFLSDLLPDDSAATTTPLGDYMRMQVVKASQIFINSTLGAVLVHSMNAKAAAAQTKLRGHDQLSTATQHQCISIDECFFNAVLRLACGATEVAVLKHITRPPQSQHDPDHQTPTASSNEATILTDDPLLGRISVFDVLEWLLGDISLLNGKEKYAVSSFPSFYYSPLSISIPKRNASAAGKRPYLLDALLMMRSRKTTGLLVSVSQDHAEETLYTLSAACLREIFAAQTNKSTIPADDELSLFNEPSQFDALASLQVLLDKLPQTFEPCHVVTGERSVAQVVQIMVSHRTRRVYIQEKGDSTAIVRGVVRASDVLRLLLQEQHTKPRYA